jgi:RNA polymerase sigma-70 factor (ECF subfamily)
VEQVEGEPRRRRFEAVARALIEPLRRYLARRTDPATADDVLSETLLICWRRLEEMPEEPLAWAYAVARNCLANADRAHRRKQRLIARIWQLDRPPEQTAPAHDPDPDLTTALARLPAMDAELLRLWAWEELHPAEIAEVVGLSPNAVSIRLHRARQKLKPMLRKREDRTGHKESTEGRRP